MHACRLPFWAYMKLLFCMWLVLPMFHGAAYIYEKHIRRYVKIGGYVSPSSNYTADQRKVLQMMSLDARKSVSQYVEKHGWEAVERAIKAVINCWIKKLKHIYMQLLIIYMFRVVFAGWKRNKEALRISNYVIRSASHSLQL